MEKVMKKTELDFNNTDIKEEKKFLKKFNCHNSKKIENYEFVKSNIAAEIKCEKPQFYEIEKNKNLSLNRTQIIVYVDNNGDFYINFETANSLGFTCLDDYFKLNVAQMISIMDNFEIIWRKFDINPISLNLDFDNNDNFEKENYDLSSNINIVKTKKYNNKK